MTRSTWNCLSFLVAVAKSTVDTESVSAAPIALFGAFGMYNLGAYQ